MNKTTIKFPKELINDCYLPYLDNQSRYLIFYGGGGSGKSWFVAQRAIIRCLNERYYRLIYLRKVARTIRDSSFQLLKDRIYEYGLQSLFIIRESTMEIECLNGNKMIAVGMDDPEKIKSIAEPTDVWCEEATEFTEEDILQLSTRLRSKKGRFNQITMSFNPISKLGWIYQKYFIKTPDNCTIVKSTYLDNKNVPQSFIEHLESLKNQDENFYNIYTLGEWGGQIKGAIYTHWRIDDNIPDGCEIIWGLDFGFNHPTALVKVHIKENDFWVEEVIHKEGMTNSQLIEKLKELNIKEPVYADSAEPQRIEEIFRAGINIYPADKEKNSVTKGIDKIKSMGFHILSNSPKIVDEAQFYKWRENLKLQKLEDREPVKFKDDALCALRYAIQTHIGVGNGFFGIEIV